jgi:hypothetical protein
MRPSQRLLLSVIAAVAALALVACGEKASDKQVAALDGEGFSVSMPGEPKRSTETVQSAAGPVVVTAYVTEGGEEGFSMSVAQFPSTVKGDLDGAVEGAASTVKGVTRDLKETTYQGFPARDLRIIDAEDSNGNKGTVFARVILAENKLYQLQFVQEGADVKQPPAAYPAFLASLKID